MSSDSNHSAPPKWTYIIVPAIIVVAFALFAVTARHRASMFTKTRIDLVPDMDDQMKYKTQNRNPLFADGRAMRYPVNHTVARGELREDETFYLGIEGNTWTEEFPIEINEKALRRGQERFNIYCATCHGLVGYGDGMTSKRADELQEGTWVPPLSYHSENLRQMPVGKLFHTVTHGIRNMPSYGKQIHEADRWKIVAYVRALQRSQNATIDDAPDEIKSALR